MQFRAHQLKQACLWHAAVEGPASKSKSLFGLIAVAAVLADNVFASAASSIIDALREATSVNSQLQTCCSFLCLDACCDSSAAASVEHMQAVAISAHTVRLPTTHRCSIAADSLTDRQLANTLRTPPPANQLSAQQLVAHSTAGRGKSKHVPESLSCESHLPGHQIGPKFMGAIR